MYVFENVLGLKTAKGGLYLEQMKKVFNEKGYQIKLHTLVAKNCGVLQNRKRIIILGWLKNRKIDILEIEEIATESNYLVKDLLNELPVIKARAGKDKFSRHKTAITDYLKFHGLRNDNDILAQNVAQPHKEQGKEIYKIAVQNWEEKQKCLNYNKLQKKLKSHNNRTSFFDRFKVVAADLPYSQTIVAYIPKEGHYYINPNINQNRSLSVREAARLQSVPDDYYFEGEKEGANRTTAFKQIGNAVPPLMANFIGQEILKVL